MSKKISALASARHQLFDNALMLTAQSHSHSFSIVGGALFKNLRVGEFDRFDDGTGGENSAH